MKKIKELTIEEFKRLMKSNEIIIKGNYIYANGNAYNLDMEVVEEVKEID